MSAFQTYDRTLAVLPTGGGKTVVFSKLAQLTDGKTLILAHRDELVDQAINKLHDSTGIFAQKEKAESKASLQSDVVVGSVQTMQGNRLARWPQNHFKLVVADEAHHAVSKSWQNTLNHFTSAKVLGVTATPDRGDKKNLGQYFQHVAYEISLFELINQGYLSRIAVKSVPLTIDLTKVRMSAGDYRAEDVGDALAPYLRSIARAIKEEAAYRRTLAFVPLRATSRAFVEILKEEGLKAEHIDGESPDRKEILKRFADSDFQVLSNAMLLTEGYDDPGIECVAILRPTKSRSLYSQMVGRGTRISDFKANLLLLDFLWLHEKHNLIRPAHLVATNDHEAHEITQAIQSGGKQEMFDLEGIASETQIKREEKLKNELAEKAKKKKREIDAMEWCMSLHVSAPDSDTIGSEPPSVSQLKRLERNGFDLGTVTSKAHASAIIERLDTRWTMGLATPKQLHHLKRFGVSNAETITFEMASTILDARFGNKQKQAA
jgi:superfamily II DNA or RNA helicase